MVELAAHSTREEQRVKVLESDFCLVVKEQQRVFYFMAWAGGMIVNF